MISLILYVQQEESPVAKKTVSPGVLFFKRLIAATLALIILTLAGLALYFGLNLNRVRKELDEAQGKLFDIEVKEMEKRAEEEAERLRNALPPEQSKPAGEANAAEILAGSTLVAHALGSVDGVDGLNCKEAFLANYEAGVRVFEADLRMTSDGFVVLRHDWIGGLQDGVDQTAIPTLDEFLAKPILGKYTSLSFRDLLLLMAQYPDVCVVTDTKFTDAEAVTVQFRAMLDEARRLGLSYLFDRMVVQIYSPQHFQVVDSIHHFPYYVYTLYQESFGQDADAFRRKAVFCQENGVMGIALWDEWWDAEYAPIADWRNIKVFVHTINDAQTAKRLLRAGVSAVYTDALVPADMEE
jgi:glycerophosphoryl diester phosphodiesterase